MRGPQTLIAIRTPSRIAGQARPAAAGSACRVILVMAGGTGGRVFPGGLAVAAIGCADAGLPHRLDRQAWQNGMEAEPGANASIRFSTWPGFHSPALRAARGCCAKLMLPGSPAGGVPWRSRVSDPAAPQSPDGGSGLRRLRQRFPLGMMAVLLGRPLLLHEQNAIAGLANRVLARRGSTGRSTAFPDTLPNARPGPATRCARTSPACAAPGAPLCSSRGSGPLKPADVVGGSLGAQALNQVVPRALALLPSASRPQVTHQSGAKNIEALRAEYATSRPASSPTRCRSSTTWRQPIAAPTW